MTPDQTPIWTAQPLVLSEREQWEADRRARYSDPSLDHDDIAIGESGF